MMSEYLRFMGQKMFEVMKLRNCFSVSSREKRFFLLKRVQTNTETHSATCSVGTWGVGVGEVLQKYIGGSMMLIFHHHLLPRLSMNRMYLSSLICLQGAPVTTLPLRFKPPFLFHR